jgi:hypothetical protein
MPIPAFPWTAEHDALFALHNDVEIAERLGISRKTVNRHRGEIGVPNPQRTSPGPFRAASRLLALLDQCDLPRDVRAAAQELRAALERHNKR